MREWWMARRYSPSCLRRRGMQGFGRRIGACNGLSEGPHTFSGESLHEKERT